jgi:hypothetical protein
MGEAQAVPQAQQPVSPPSAPAPSPAPAHAPPFSRLYIANVILFAIVATLAWIWYEIHIKVLTTAAIVGTGVSVATIIAFAAARLQRFVGERVAAFFDKLLSAKATTVILAAALVFTIGVLFTTSSIRLVSGMTPDAGDEYRVAVDRLDGTKVVESRSITFDKDHLTDQRPYFTLTPITFRVRTEKPPIYADVSVKVARGGIQEKRLMTNEQRRQVHLVRLFPGKSLAQRLFDGRANTHYTLEIVRDDVVVAKVAAMQFQPVWIGGKTDELEWYRKSFESDETKKQAMSRAFDNYVMQPNNDDPSGRVKQRWVQHSAVADSPAFTPGTRLIARVTRNGSPPEDTMIIVSDDDVTNAIVEGPR